MQKQALKGLFFNISTCFSPHLAVFFNRRIQSNVFPLTSPFVPSSLSRRQKLAPHPTACLYNEGVPFLPNRPFLAANHCLFVHPQTFHFFPILAKLERIA